MIYSTNDFFFYSYFGISQKKAKEEPKLAFEKCFYKSYGDACRHFPYLYSANSDNGKKKEYKDLKDSYLKKMLNLFHRKIDNFSFQNQDEFDIWHSDFCEEIIKSSENNELFKQDQLITYGQAQKWINMMLKHMLIMNLWKNINKHKEYFHIPIDSIIIYIACKLIEKGETISLPKTNDKGTLTSEKVLSWNNWSNEKSNPIYKNFQDDIKNYILKTDYKTVIDWESDMWIKYQEDEQ